jgi:hypothetical protein
MTTPQDPARRKKQKRRREKQLATWRANHSTHSDAVPTVDKPEEKASAGARHRG